MVDSPFNEDPKIYIFFQGGPNFGGGTYGNFREIKKISTCFGVI